METQQASSLFEAALAGRENSPQEWMAYLHEFHRRLPNANDLFTLLKTRSNDTSYSLLAKTVSAGARAVLDLGCGDGNLIEELVTHTPATTAIYGVDISAPEIELATRRFAGEPRVGFEVGDASALPYDTAFFDCVVAHQFLNLLPGVQPYLSEIARVLKPGARLLFVANRGWQSDRSANWIKLNDAAFASVQAEYPNVVWPKMGDRRFYDEAGIRQIFQESGRFDTETLSIGSFTSSAFMTPDRVAAMYNRLYFYALMPKKKNMLGAVLARAEELASGGLVEISLPFRLVSIRTTYTA